MRLRSTVRELHVLAPSQARVWSCVLPKVDVVPQARPIRPQPQDASRVSVAGRRARHRRTGRSVACLGRSRSHEHLRRRRTADRLVDVDSTARTLVGRTKTSSAPMPHDRRCRDRSASTSVRRRLPRSLRHIGCTAAAQATTGAWQGPRGRRLRPTRTCRRSQARRGASTISVHTRPFAGSAGWPGSPRTPRTARTVSPTGRRRRPTEDDHGRGAVAGDVGTRGVDDVGEVDRVAQVVPAKRSSMSFLPNSRFMNELEVICPT